jgi:hypothetical protein
MPPQWKVGQRVRCLATRFNNDDADADGKFFSDHHLARTGDTYVEGVVKRKLARPANTYKVLYDGDTSQSKSPGTHLLAVPDDASSSDEDTQGEVASTATARPLTTP